MMTFDTQESEKYDVVIVYRTIGSDKPERISDTIVRLVREGYDICSLHTNSDEWTGVFKRIKKI